MWVDYWGRGGGAKGMLPPPPLKLLGGGGWPPPHSSYAYAGKDISVTPCHIEKIASAIFGSFP